MQTQNITQNIKYSMLNYIIINALRFVVRFVFVKTLPIEYLGVNGLLWNVLAMLSLAEMGVGPAMVYSLYKPLAYGDKSTTNSIMHLFKKAYIFIGVIIFIIGVFFIPFIDSIIKDGNAVPDIKYFYFIFLVNTAVSYLWSYKRSLLIADQKQYIVNIYVTVVQIIISVVQIILLIIFNSYWCFVIFMLCGTILENLSISKKVDKEYNYFNETPNKLNNEIKNNIIKNVKAMFGHKVGNIITFSSANIVLSKFVGLTAVGLYSNYYMVITALNHFAGKFFEAITASIGNLMVVEESSKIVKAFKFMEFITALQAAVCFCGLYVLFMFKDAAGLYWNDRYKPVAEAIINLTASVYLTIHHGVIGVVLGGIISTLLTCFWVEPYILFNNGINVKLKDYFIDYFKFTVVAFCAALVSKFIYTNLFDEVTLINFIADMFLCVIITLLLWFAVFRNREEMQYLMKFIRQSIVKIKPRHF